MINLDQIFKLKIYSFFSFLFLFSIFIHKFIIFKNFPFIKISELIFIPFFVIYLFLDYKKIIRNFSTTDLLFFSWPVLNILQFFFNSSNLYGALSSIYVFGIYILFKNLFLDIGTKKIIRYLIISLIFSAILSIVGWSTSQFNIDLNLAEYKEGFPIYIIEKYRSHSLFPTPNMLFFYLSFGFLIIQNFNFKNKSAILFIILLGILFTLSKSLIIFFPLIFSPYIFKHGSTFYKNIYTMLFLIIFIIFNFLTNFIIAPKKINFFNDHKHSNYMMSESKALHDNNFFTIYKTNYAELKIKSFKLIKDNFLLGIGFDNFRKLPMDKFEDIQVYKPHSSIIGLIVENGFVALIIFFFIFKHLLKVTLQQKNNFFLPVLIFILIESINMDIHYFKILWIFMPMILMGGYSRFNLSIN